MRRRPRKCRILSITFALICVATAFLSLFNFLFDDPAAKKFDRQGSLQVFSNGVVNNDRYRKRKEFHSCFDTKNNYWRLPAVPHFIIAGVQKGGTSALRGILVKHPKLVTSMKFEPHYFDQRLQRYLLNKYQATEIKPAWLCDIQQHYIQTTFYKEALEKAKDEELYFYEKTPSYLVDPDVPGLIHSICTWKPKILVMLRDPIERAYSHYKMEREKKRVKGSSFDSIIHDEVDFLRKVGLSRAPVLPVNVSRDELENFARQLHPDQFELPSFSQKISDVAHREVIQNLSYTNFLQRGLYSVQLERWLKYFPLGESLMIVKFEEFQKNPAEVYERILNFVGVPMFRLQPKDFEKKYHTRGVLREKTMIHPPISNETRRYLQHFFQPYNNQLTKMLGKNLYEEMK